MAMLLVSMEDANMHSDDESLINSHRSSPSTLSSRLPYAQSKIFWGQKKAITLAEKGQAGKPGRLLLSHAEPITSKKPREGKLAGIMDKVAHLRQRKPQKLDANLGNRLGLKVAHRESLAKIGSLKEQLTDLEMRSSQREQALQTAIKIAKQEHKDLQKEVRKLREGELQKDSKGQQTEEQGTHNTSVPAGPLTPERSETPRATEKVCSTEFMKPADVTSLEEGIRRLGRQYVAEKVSKSQADGRRAQLRVARLLNLIQEAQRAALLDVQTQGMDCTMCIELRRKLLAAGEEIRVLKAALQQKQAEGRRFSEAGKESKAGLSERASREITMENVLERAAAQFADRLRDYPRPIARTPAPLWWTQPLERLKLKPRLLAPPSPTPAWWTQPMDQSYFAPTVHN